MELLKQEIAKIEASIDEYNEADMSVMYDSIDAITNAGCKLEAVEPLLQLFERHPTTYFGTPGPIVHFIEQFGPTYEKDLIGSLRRTPTTTTTWMLNRCINTKKEKEEWIGILKEIVNRPDVAQEIRAEAQEYIDFQANR